MGLCLAIGCQQPDPTGDSGAPIEPPAIALEASQPVWDGPAVEAALEAALVDGMPTPAPPILAYFGLMALGDELCPGDPSQLTDAVILGCTAANGAWFGGVSEWLDVAGGLPNPGNYQHYQVQSLVGDFEIRDPSGRVFRAGGNMTRVLWSRVGTRGFSGELVGTWGWEGDAGWLADGLSANLSIRAFEDRGGDRLRLQGGLQVHGLALELRPLRYGPACPSQPEGAVEIRDPSGAWHHLELGACEACGQLWVGGEGDPVEICPDLSAIPSQIEGELGWGSWSSGELGGR